jgi:hypothetical protein
VELERNQNDFKKAGVAVMAVAYDSVAVLHTFAERRAIRFPLLSDPGSKLIRAMGILNTAIPKDDPYFGSPYPSTFVLNAKNVIVAKYFEDDPRMTRVFTNILTHRFGAVPESRRSSVEGRRLKVIATSSHSLVTAAQRVSLTLDIDLKPAIHVYAPGAVGYSPIEWTIKDSAATSAFRVRYPRTQQTLRLDTSPNPVPVYLGRFRLRGDITIADDATLRDVVDNHGNFSVEGLLRYQACDDRTCYPPQTVPTKWTFHYIGFDRQRETVGQTAP